MSASYTGAARELFERFALRHGLSYKVDEIAPVELLWRFPEQPGLSIPIWLGLQNRDELTFGALDFQMHLFPFTQVSERFELIVDAWVERRAQIVCAANQVLPFLIERRLELLSGGEWNVQYRHRRWGRSQYSSGTYQNNC